MTTNINNKTIKSNNKKLEHKESQKMTNEENIKEIEESINEEVDIKEMERKLEEEFEFTIAECYFEDNYKSHLLVKCQNLLKKQLEDLSFIMNFNNVINTFELADEIQYLIDKVKLSINSHHGGEKYYLEHGIDFYDDLINNITIMFKGEK